ncbi:MAG: hypothetical protein HY238_09240 [Acidobacteria bacterium]|nr:hypothetical protein [Acidobacteriota bacterium]
MSAVHVGQRVNFGAGVEQGFRNFNGVFWSLLAVTLDAVGGDVMKQRRAMHRRVKVRDTRRTRSNQFRIFAQQRFQRGQVTCDNRLHARFELEDRRTVPSNCFDVFRKRGPTLEVVPARDGELSIGQLQRGASNFRVRQVLWQPGDFRVQETGMVLVDDPDCLGIARSVGFEQFLGLFLVLIQGGANR